MLDIFVIFWFCYQEEEEQESIEGKRSPPMTVHHYPISSDFQDSFNIKISKTCSKNYLIFNLWALSTSRSLFKVYCEPKLTLVRLNCPWNIEGWTIPVNIHCALSIDNDAVPMSFNSHCKPMRKVILWIPFYRWGNRDSES